MTEILQINLSALLPGVAGTRDASVRRLIGSLSGHEGFEYIFAAEAVRGQPAKLCIHYNPHVLTPSRIQEMTRRLCESLRSYICHGKENHKLTSRLP